MTEEVTLRSVLDGTDSSFLSAKSCGTFAMSLGKVVDSLCSLPL